ncbi:molybdenum-pterin-binding-protein [Shigella dysenteriae]|uniref:Molybdenum-pterin-binding-protein n=1 Tax=Shigella dysenteriae TaxID=622 RepID=A0A2X2I7Q0_SHIDY|nr:molybdenum-pterin-binding-protein [Shigella dysenteriae]
MAIVTHSSQQALGLAKGKEAIALIKAPWVTLATEDCGLNSLLATSLLAACRQSPKAQ